MSRNSLLSTLFPNEPTDELVYNPPIQDYLTKLGTYKIKDLNTEPDKLKQEALVLQEQIQELAITNYKTFIETALCSKDLFTKFSVIEDKVNDLLGGVPVFEEKCETFGEVSSKINALRRIDSITLAKSAQILEILEIPQLMTSFIRDGLYEDALELFNYVRKLSFKHSDVAIFKNINDDVNKAWILMLHQLLSQLRQDISLPKCLQIVGHLRRMDIFSEPELRLKFLQTRTYWLEQQLNSLGKEDPTVHLTKTIEVTRINLFNILTQYSAIFNDDERSPLTVASDKTINQPLIFKGWVQYQIGIFVKTLDSCLDNVTSFEMILDQCMYFGHSFSKVGCDFRHLLIPIFTKHIQKRFVNNVAKADRNFMKNIEKFTLIDKNNPSKSWKFNKDDTVRPPESLLEFYPLAEYLNNILAALNQLRLCPPIALIDEVVDTLQASMLLIAKCLQKLYSQEQQAFSVNSKDAFTRLCMCFSDDLVPFVQKCIHIIYPPSHIASKLGISLKNLQDTGTTFLDKQEIISPISHLLPVKIEPVVPVVETEVPAATDPEVLVVSDEVESKVDIGEE
ncbi:conserved oligomeric Golgi complex subunit 8 [Diabrotica virgifera virgifera]|uniref:Conserved oligomeric Golgi complex subunit 8 n=1 Tax=Diabrotica virgifera virgifera TaxID=50390 RepID=A0A6P7H079_DIAVI|nr:conserved oligomeric Golgi complex subunit 8 [Diabrotica virgifera virgifera]